MTRSLSGVLGIPGLVDDDAAQATAASIAAAQHPSGAVPSSPGGLLDPWDHVQSAMGLAVAGRLAEAEAAYAWSAHAQRPDGSWAASYRAGGDGGDLQPVEDHTDANFCAYLATGVWHHWLSTADPSFVERLWPTVERGVETTLRHRRRDGAFSWASSWASGPGGVESDALLTGTASIQLSLRHAVALAGLVGERRPSWEAAAAHARHVVHQHPEAFSPKPTHAMDWYYPVLTGAVPQRESGAWLDRRWDEFVVPGLGVRCVSDHPWVTGGESAELALALARVGRDADAVAVLAAMQHLRHDDGSYWTGLVYADGLRWPVERTTWTGATVLLALDALSGATPAAGLFGDADLVAVTDDEESACPCLLAS